MQALAVSAAAASSTRSSQLAADEPASSTQATAVTAEFSV
eukprot:CAMPEP_0185568514 /NCGR_PEP_ID=MMETSP0434-20130131/1460_1 /TAXON_ID=626734 ORGANISM="Favella taraikaensis, Strain Fe Narragansett Bay" /NCGR_SAMPLE_ID=MMETSP0434 /ASSEMBLY_ACC=CAM_ASM_000379 /LENGTH=39 /DNA_ID= /DNA_START= /DNA_END= /DNA_ORIENTATION=